MSNCRRGVALTPMETRRDVILRAAILADELGYEMFSVPEGWGLDSTPIVTEIALRTHQIRLVSGVLSIWGRTPGTLAMTAATLHQIAAGRYVLGLGASTRALAEGFHDRAFSHPANTFRDSISGVRALLAGEAAQLKNGSTARPIRLGRSPVPELPIWVAALGERTMQVAAELADGWMPIFLTRDRLIASRHDLGRARVAAGKRAEPLTVAAGPICVVDPDPVRARHMAASLIVWYLCAMGDVYARTVAAQGYAPAVQAIQAANPRPRPYDGVIPSEAEPIVDEFAASGNRRQVRDQLESWASAVDIVMLALPAGVPWDNLEATLRAAAPAG
jgi:alkanesulfonate monooxygenase SsuD/methylene tetrahydromethanopterin reductase-like flavin-dependent oxidoreductase (luciferase family)